MASSLNFFDDVFHSHGDDDDIQEDETVDFDYLAIETESKREMGLTHEKSDAAVQAEERRLSQRLSQLSATEERTIKRFKADKRTTNEPQPAYVQAMDPWLQQQEGAIPMARLIHDLATNKLLIAEWEIYLHSGTGQLKVFFPQQQKFSVRTNPTIWPAEVKKTMEREGAMNDRDCLSFAEDYLRRLQAEVQKWEGQLHELKRNSVEVTEEMVQTIERLVDQYSINEAKLRSEKNILLVEYNYRDRLLELEFEQLKPTEEQLRLYRELYQAKVTFEQSKANVDILKQHVFYKVFPDGFDSFRLPPPPQIDSITDASLQQALNNRYERIVQQTKLDMMAMHIAVAEAKMRQCQHDLQLRNREDQWSKDMMALIQRRFKDYEERIRRLYHLKMTFFVRAPAVVEQNC